MDKKVFLLDKDSYTKEMVEHLTEKDLEEWISEEDYNDNYSIIKIDANGYDNPEVAIACEFFGSTDGLFELDDYYVFAFGF